MCGLWSITIKHSSHCRHPIPASRPTFTEILTSLLGEKEEMLSIPEKDASTHPQASLLGASLEAGLEMYKNLQNTYLNQKNSTPSPKPKRYTTMSTSRKEREEQGKERGRESSGAEWCEGQYEMEESDES